MDSLVFENPDLNSDGSCQPEEIVGQQEAIDFSSTLIGVFEDLCEDESGLSVEELKAVYREAGENCRISSCPDMNLWAMARVNMFVRMKSQKEIKQNIMPSLSPSTGRITELELESPRAHNDLGAINATEDWEPSKEDFELAKSYIGKYDLQFNFSSIDELYIDEYKPLELEIE